LSCFRSRCLRFRSNVSQRTTKSVTSISPNKILATKKRDPEANTTAWEREIDRLVYKLHDMTPEEIALVSVAETAAATAGGRCDTQRR
jgi:hypothetical protein